MDKKVINAKAWGFEKGEKAKLMWIGEPFKQNNKWMVNAYFKGNKITKKLTLDWADIHFLSVGKYYTDGNLNNGEALENETIIDIDLRNIKAEYKEREGEIWGKGFKDKTKSKTFSFRKNGTLYVIPIIEIIRTVLAPDGFWLNRIVEMDTLENYFTYELNENTLNIYFTSLYEPKLLKDEKINNLSWLVTNPMLLRMFNSIGSNIWNLGDLKFDFIFDNFFINARVEKKDGYIRVLQILSVKKKKINVDEVNIYHPSLEEAAPTSEHKKRRFVNISNGNDRELDSEASGSTDSFEEIDTFLISHEYEIIPKINKVKSGRKLTRSKEDENTKTYILEDNKLRTTADIGGEDTVKGLEFNNLCKVEVEGELEDFMEVLKLLEKRPNVKSVDIIIDFLPEIKKERKFSKLNDGITRRKYAVGKIEMVDCNEVCLLEVEREEKSLSMLILKSHILINWKTICRLMAQELVNESGKWSNALIRKIEIQGIVAIRKKHIKRSIQETEKQIYDSITD